MDSTVSFISWSKSYRGQFGQGLDFILGILQDLEDVIVKYFQVVPEASREVLAVSSRPCRRPTSISSGSNNSFHNGRMPVHPPFNSMAIRFVFTLEQQFRRASAFGQAWIKLEGIQERSWEVPGNVSEVSREIPGNILEIFREVPGISAETSRKLLSINPCLSFFH